MTITLLHEQRETLCAGEATGDGRLWLDAAAIEAATGWTWKPEGLCQGELCLPLPPAARGELVRGDRLDLAAMWRRSGQPVVSDAAGSTWVLGTGAQQRAQALGSLQAPDFELPDLQGETRRLSHFRGRKVLLATWASW